MRSKQYYAAPIQNENQAPPLTKAEIKHVVNVAGVSGRTPERDQALLLCSITTGLRVTEISSIEIRHILSKDGSFKLEGWIPGKYTKSGKPGPIFVNNKSFQQALIKYFDYRIIKGHQISDNPDQYRGLRPDAKVFLTETGYRFAMSKKTRMIGKGKKKEPKDYYACDVLERVFKRLYIRAFGENTKFSSHSGRKTFCNRLTDLVHSKKIEDTDLNDVVTLMRSHDLIAIQPYLIPSKKDIFDMCKAMYVE